MELAAARCLRVAFSGGLDSTVLLHALARRRPPSLTAVHVNHGLQPAAAQWQRHCAAVCAGLAVPFESHAVQVRDHDAGPEAAARAARYRCFEALLAPGDWLLQGHHLDDLAETLLLRLLRGAGPEGLAGMPRRRALGAGQLLRPFLELPRAALADYAAHWHLHWVDDPSNRDTRLDRNYLRREVLPLIETRWPGYRRTFARSAAQLAASAAALPVPALAPCRSSAGDPGFRLASLPAPPLDAAALRRWLRALCLDMPPAARLADFLAQLRGGRGAQLRLGERVLERYRDGVYCRRVLPPPPGGPLSLVPGRTLAVPGAGRVRLRAAAPVAAAPALQLRFRRGGERLATADGRHLRLKTLFQDRALPPWWRDRVPLLFAGDELLAVGALRRAPRAAAAGLTLAWAPPLVAAPGAAAAR